MGGTGHGETVITSAEESSGGQRGGGVQGQTKAVEFGGADDVRARSAVDNYDRFPDGLVVKEEPAEGSPRRTM